MLSKIFLLSALIFAITYPFCFWISVKDPLKQNFHRFHLGLPCFVAGVTTAVILFSSVSDESKGLMFAWCGMLLSLAYINWQRPYPYPVVVSLASAYGLFILPVIFPQILGTAVSQQIIWISILAGFIFSAALYAMNLGHWYLNVRGLPMKHLRWSVDAFGVLLSLRLLIDLGSIIMGTVWHQGEKIQLFHFLMTTDGIFLWIAIFFGTLFPLFSLYFVHGTLKFKNTQSATGILYVILIAILIGDLTYKYYLIKFGIAL